MLGVDESATEWTFAMLASERAQAESKLASLALTYGVSVTDLTVDEETQTVHFIATVSESGLEYDVTVGRWRNHDSLTFYPVDYLSNILRANVGA